MAYAQDGLFASIQAAKAASPGLSAKELALNHGCCRQTISTVVRKPRTGGRLLQLCFETGRV
jgi:hypothetical protein